MVGIAVLPSPRPIRPDDEVADFACGESALDIWLKANALKSEGRTARTYVVSTDGAVIAYYCLATGAVARDSAPGRIRRNAPDPIPVVVIGRLAVAASHQGRGLGEAMLQDAMRRAIAVADVVGCAALLVHAIDEKAAAFYERYGFLAFPTGGRTLFLPFDTLRTPL